MDRAFVARFWKTLPSILAPLPEIELRRLREFALRSIEAEKAAIEAAKLGAKTPGRGAKSGDGF